MKEKKAQRVDVYLSEDQVRVLAKRKLLTLKMKKEWRPRAGRLTIKLCGCGMCKDMKVAVTTPWKTVRRP